MKGSLALLRNVEKKMSGNRIVLLVFSFLFAGGLSACTASGSDCSQDSDCLQHQQCSPGGGVFFGGGICLDKMSAHQTGDVGKDTSDGHEADLGAVQDADSDVEFESDVSVESDADAELDSSHRDHDTDDSGDSEELDVPASDVLSAVIMKSPGVRSESSSAEFSFECSRENNPEVDAECTYECRLDVRFAEVEGEEDYTERGRLYQDWTDCEKDFSLNTLWAGDYTLYVRATAEDGDSAEANHSWTKTYVGWKSVSAGQSQTCAIDEQDLLWCWGTSSVGSLGMKDLKVSKTPGRVLSDVRWKSVSVGVDHVCGVSHKNELWCWGSNEFKQLGIEGLDSVSVPAMIKDLNNGWSLVSAGWEHTCGVYLDYLFCWGTGYEGELGQPGVSSLEVPKPVSFEEPRQWVSISVGFQQSCAVNSSEELWCWGSNKYGQIGLDKPAAYNVPSQVKHADRRWDSVSTGFRFACGITRSAVWCWGTDHNGQLGLGEVEGNHLPIMTMEGGEFVQVDSRGALHSCAINRKHELFCWGDGTFGKLGLGNELHGTKPDLVKDAQGSDWEAVSVGLLHTCGIRNKNELWCWGTNQEFQLGLEGPAKVSRPQKLRVHQD